MTQEESNMITGFIADTKVLMDDNTEKDIKDIKVGDIVMTHVNNKKRVSAIVTKQFTGNLYKIKPEGWANSISATPDQNALIFDKFTASFMRKKLREVKSDEYLLIPNCTQCKVPVLMAAKDIIVVHEYGYIVAIKTIEVEQAQNLPVYSVTVEDDGTLVTNGIGFSN